MTDQENISEEVVNAILVQAPYCCESFSINQYAKQGMYCVHRDYQHLVITMKKVKGDAAGADKLLLAAMALASSAMKFVQDISAASKISLKVDTSDFNEEDLD